MWNKFVRETIILSVGCWIFLRQSENQEAFTSLLQICRSWSLYSNGMKVHGEAQNYPLGHFQWRGVQNFITPSLSHMKLIEFFSCLNTKGGSIAIIPSTLGIIMNVDGWRIIIHWRRVGTTTYTLVHLCSGGIQSVCGCSLMFAYAGSVRQRIGSIRLD